MITEFGRVVAIETDSLWVQTLRQSACDSCNAKSGCGQKLLAGSQQKSGYLRVLLEGRDPADYAVGDSVTIGIPEGVVANSSLVAYLLPLLLMVAGTLIADHWWESEAAAVVGALTGLMMGAYGVRRYGDSKRSDPRFQPVIVDSCVRFSDLGGHPE